MKLFDYQNYYFIGIGGIGVSAIARMLKEKGKNVSGSDSSKSEITEDLEKTGIKINIGQKAENIKEDTEVVIYTIAIPENNPELLEARNRGIVCKTYPEALGEISKEMYTVAISGTHGKTTTTGMISHIMKEAGLDPTVIIGSKLNGKNSNFLSGKSNYLVVEACEYKRSFLNLSPQILVITNIEADHLDYYKDLEDIKNAFREIANKVPEDGFIITDLESQNIQDCLVEAKAKVINYKDIKENLEIKLPGEHNQDNAKAAIKTLESLGVEKEKCIEYIKSFHGTWRRLEYKGEKDNTVYYDDYAHHPTEIRASLLALKQKYPEREIICVFEAHQQSRTKLLFNDFIQALSLSDKVYLAPILTVREEFDPTITNTLLSDAINKNSNKELAETVENVEELKQKLENIKTDPSVQAGKPLCVVLMGAGNIYTWTKKLL